MGCTDFLFKTSSALRKQTPHIIITIFKTVKQKIKTIISPTPQIKPVAKQREKIRKRRQCGLLGRVFQERVQ